ncbi:glycine zipper 2TM domain-containing protein [Ramlibacter sp.]|uniref:glycine zipper 2TM domain-containing protein n=1 Tax=Ramlibacter sp. TaxID=1917967 RepID=UPI003D0CCA00
MKKLAILSALLAAFGAQAQSIAPAGAPTFTDRARVQSVEPQYESVQVPREECTSAWVNDARPPVAGTSLPGMLIGGVAGGLLGHQVGKGSGKDVATAAGAVVGAIAGDRIASRDAAAPVYGAREVRQCRTVYETQQRAAGYRVTYEYRGQLYTTQMREQPGNSLPVRVSVTPIDEREYHRR